MISLTLAQRQQLTNAAPNTHADHLVGSDSTGYAVVRVDALGRRIVAVGATAAEAIERSKPKAAPAPHEAAAPASGLRASRRAAKGAAEPRKIDADVFAAELAEYRRAVAAVGIEAPELL